MGNYESANEEQFRNLVVLKFQLYNSLFTSLPFQRIERTGILLTLLQNFLEEGYEHNEFTSDLIEQFFKSHTSLSGETAKTDLLFRFVQYAERQVVLFDSLEDAAFKYLHDMQGKGMLKQFDAALTDTDQLKSLEEKLQHFCVRLVLTAHPTQFYPGTVLGIINDLSKALSENDTAQINMYLKQLGKTAFFKKQKPTPLDEATSLIWYLENIFYPAIGKICNFLQQQYGQGINRLSPMMQMGFWPGGDRDGNPFVTVDITLAVADALRGSIIKCYYLNVRKIRRRLTFAGVEAPLFNLEKKLYNEIFIPGFKKQITVEDILETLESIRLTIIERHDGLFVQLVDDLINKVNVFGLYFATLDIRQNSFVHSSMLGNLHFENNSGINSYRELNDEEKLDAILSLSKMEENNLTDEIEKDTFDTITAIKRIQQYNGEAGSNRYIISHCNSALNVMEVYALFVLAGWQKDTISVDIVPLFETIEDLKNAPDIMRQLYNIPVYKKHLAARGNKQSIMVGFSDGTKDGGYLTANWGIYKAKESISAVGRELGVETVYFDGRGGPPARGGGKTQQFYASMGEKVAGREIQLTVQGQTVSSKFGTIDAARFNMEQLLFAGLKHGLVSDNVKYLNKRQEELIQMMADFGFNHYINLKNDPDFLNYLLQVSPLRFYGQTNIGSRPSKRGDDHTLKLEDLRAIPFVGSWSQIKQNVTGYYGVGVALQQMEEKGYFTELQLLYKDSLFFKTMIDNCEMSMLKCFFPLTAHIASDEKHGRIWKMIKDEYDVALHYILKLTGHDILMKNFPVERQSIGMREKIVLPLLAIQQYAITRIREADAGDSATKGHSEVYGKLAMRCSFGIINAARNSA